MDRRVTIFEREVIVNWVRGAGRQVGGEKAREWECSVRGAGPIPCPLYLLILLSTRLGTYLSPD